MKRALLASAASLAIFGAAPMAHAQGFLLGVGGKAPTGGAYTPTAPVLIGSYNATATGTAYGAPLTGSCAAGKVVIVAAAVPTLDVASVVDSHGASNTYAKAFSSHDHGAAWSLFGSKLTVSLASGDQVAANVATNGSQALVKVFCTDGSAFVTSNATNVDVGTGSSFGSAGNITGLTAPGYQIGVAGSSQNPIVLPSSTTDVTWTILSNDVVSGTGDSMAIVWRYGSGTSNVTLNGTAPFGFLGYGAGQVTAP